MKDLVSIYEECKDICRDLNIPIRENTPIKYNGRIRTKWGYCRDKKDGTFEISIAKVLGEDSTPKKTLMATILHEMLHTCPGCFNHGKLWKDYCKRIKEAYGIKIRTTSDTEDMKIESHYYVKCRRCEIKVWYPMKPVNKEQRCPVCGSKRLSCFYKKNGVKEKLWKRG